MNSVIMNLRSAWILILWLAAANAWGRGGGGCFEQGTLVLTPRGPFAIEQLRIGDAVWSVQAGGLVPAMIQARIEVQPDAYVELSVAGRTLRVTEEHPFQTAPGEFRTAASLSVGDTLWLWDADELRHVILESTRRIHADRPAYNLLVTPGGTYLADGVLVHNKGCFLPETPVLRADGTTIPISTIRPGEKILAFSPDEKIVTGTVEHVITHRVEDFVIVTTEQIQLRVTLEHPFYVGHGTFKTLEALHVGDTIFAYDDGRQLTPQRITGLEVVHAPTLVYNLQTDSPHTYFASGVAVHNKGGGCFPAGTPVRTPLGDVAIEKLKRGDAVLAVDETGRLIETIIDTTFTTQSALFTLQTDRGPLVTTEEHPLLGSHGEFHNADEFRVDDRIMACHKGRLLSARILSTRAASELVPVYNLRVGGPHTYIAGGFVVHNKGGGCFPAGTQIQTKTGALAIEQLQPGAEILAVDEQGQMVPSTVRAVFSSQSPLLIVNTTLGPLPTTAEHPIRRMDGSFCAAADLQIGEPIGYLRNGTLIPARVIQLRFLTNITPVYNLQVDAPHTFFAGGFAVHNKGGGGGGGGSRSSGGSSSSGSGGGGYVYSSGSSSGSPASLWEVLFFAGLFVGILFLIVAHLFKNAMREENGDEDLDFVFSPEDVEAKAGKTRKLLEFIARVDSDFSTAALETVARETFLKLQECWQARQYAPMEPLLMNDLYAQHLQQIAGLVRHHEINMIADLKVLRIDLVNIRYTHKKNDREFTALITARSRDYYVDDRTSQWVRGDDSAATFQEFWTFQRWDDHWRLREIEQTRESDALKDENFFEQFTDEGVNQIYEDEAGKEGPAGPWLQPGVEGKASRTERLLNFLVTTDKLWNRKDMLEFARELFVEVKINWEALEVTPELAAKLFPDVAASLATEIAKHKERKTVFQFRNLCVRKVELLLVRNYAENSADEFTVRIHAHAQQIVHRNGMLISREDYVRPFEEYWTFGRLDRQWKLKEILPPARGQGMISEENTDEESSPEQLQWFYSKSRAT